MNPKTHRNLIETIDHIALNEQRTVVEQIGYRNPVADLYQIVSSLKNPFPERQSFNDKIKQKLNTTTPAIDSPIVGPGDTRKVGAGNPPAAPAKPVPAKPVPANQTRRSVARELYDKSALRRRDDAVLDFLARQRDNIRGVMTGEGDADDVRQIDRIISQGEAGARTGLRMEPRRPDIPGFRPHGTPYDGYYDPTMMDPNVITRDQVRKDLEFTKERNQRMTRFIERNKDKLSGKSPDEVERAFRDREEILKSFTDHLAYGSDLSSSPWLQPENVTIGRSPDQIEKDFNDQLKIHGKRRIYPGTDE